LRLGPLKAILPFARATGGAELAFGSAPALFDEEGHTASRSTMTVSSTLPTGPNERIQIFTPDGDFLGQWRSRRW
jgi:hypothetical protein